MARSLATGDSIAVSGVCLTALAITDSGFEADLLDETLKRTSLGSLAPGSSVNLELPTPAGTPLGGHVVQGHVDGVGRFTSLTAVTMGAPEETDWLLRLSAPAPLAKYIVEKGSLSVNGISLTVAAVEAGAGGVADVTIAIIPHTYARGPHRVRTCRRAARAGRAGDDHGSFADRDGLLGFAVILSERVGSRGRFSETRLEAFCLLIPG